MLATSVWLALSRHGRIKLGEDDDAPEFSTVSWLTMLFAAGMGVGLLYWGTAEPLTHYLLISEYEDPRRSASMALFITNFHWGLHAWAIYALTGLVIAYFSFRQGCPSLVSAPIVKVFGINRVTRIVGWLSDLLAIVAIAIGLGGSVAMGVFQVKEGVDALFGLQDTGMALTLGIFVVLCLSYILPLMVDLSRGMALLSNTAMAIAGGLMVFILLTGPTYFVMGGIVQATGEYLTGAFAHGFRTFTFMDERDSHLHGLVARLGAVRRRVHRANLEGAHDPGVHLRGDPGADRLLDSVVRGLRRRRFLWHSASRLADPGRGQQQRKRHHVFRARLFPVAVRHRVRRDRGGLSVHCNQRGERGLRARHVLDRRRSQPEHACQTQLGCRAGGAGTGDDPLRQHGRGKVDHRAGRPALCLHRSGAGRVPPEGAQDRKADLAMSNLLDTIMNIEVFAFIGLLVWLYFKPTAEDDGNSSEPADLLDSE
jgi:hypothetical protein